MNETSWRLPREKVLSREEVQKVMEVAKKNDERDYTFLAIAANTGLRLCEVVHLKAGDLARGQLRITRRKKKTLRPETIDVVPDLATLMHGWLHKLFQGGTQDATAWLFPGKSAPCIIKRSNGTTEQACNGGHVSKRDIQRRWELILAEAGLRMPGRGIHSLRHFAVTEFYALHRDLRAAQMFAGHSSSTITEVYAHVCDMKEKIQAMKPAL